MHSRFATRSALGAAVVAIVGIVAARPATADRWDHHDWHHHDGYRHPGYYGGPAPAYGYGYAYGPPPPVVYAPAQPSVGLNLVVPIR